LEKNTFIYEVTHHILVGAICYEKRSITGWGKLYENFWRPFYEP